MTKIATKKREWSFTDPLNSKYQIYQYKYYRDGENVIVTYRGQSANSICVDRISTDSTVNLCTITDTGFGWAVDIDASKVITIGTYGIRVYNFDGSLSHESSSITWSSSSEAVSIDVIDGYLCVDNTVVNLTTLDVMSNIYASIDPKSPLVNSGAGLQFITSIPMLAKSMFDNAHISTIIPPNNSSYSNGKSNSGPILGVNLTKMQFGGWVNE